MAIKYGSSAVTAVKWGSTNISKVLWGSTQVFPDLVTLFNGGSASSTFTGMTGEIFDATTGDTHEWFCYEASYFVSNNKSWGTTNPYTSSSYGNLATFSLTNGIYSKCEGHIYEDSNGYWHYICGRTKFVYKNNKIDFTNKSTIEITLTSSTNSSMGYTPIYVGGITTASTGSNKFTWCVRSSITKNTTSTASFTIPTANRNADCYLAIILLGHSTDNADYVHGTNTITKIAYY